jgi:tRNA-Thr(GGU) m(6)t(6)A37 methyltransferase TsaA
MNPFVMHPIGIIHTPFKDLSETPIQSSRSTILGEVEVFMDFIVGLDGVEDFSHLILLYVWHLAPKAEELKVKPFLDNHKYGVFATRYPCRPNPIGISVVQLIERGGNRLKIRGVDMLDETPLLDIKPYVPEFDIHIADRIGWYSRRAYS